MWISDLNLEFDFICNLSAFVAKKEEGEVEKNGRASRPSLGRQPLVGPVQADRPSRPSSGRPVSLPRAEPADSTYRPRPGRQDLIGPGLAEAVLFLKFRYFA